MRRVLCFLVFGYWILGFGISKASEWQRIETGLSYKTIVVSNPVNQSTKALIHVFKVSPKKFSFQPLLPQSVSSIREMTEKTNALIGVNANFFDPLGKPLGLVISNGRRINPLRPVSWWGVFYLENSSGYITPASKFEFRPSISTAIQAGPRLVVAGEVPPLKPSLSAKTAVGLNRRGELLLLTTLSRISVKDLAHLMASAEKEGGLACVDALNFDGGSSTQMYAKIGDFELTLPSYVEVPVGLGVFRK